MVVVAIVQKKQAVFTKTLEQVESKIKSGIWRPGDRLPTLPNLSEELNVSITTLREVLRILENKNIITIEQGRGMFVRSDLTAVIQDLGHTLSPVELKELFEARSILEPELAAMAAQRAFMDEVKEIRYSAEQMADLVNRHEYFIEADLKFHFLIAKASHNNMLFQMFQLMREQLRKSREHTNLIPGMIDKAVHYHLMISEGIEERNPERVRLLMRSHMDDVTYELKQL